MKMLSWGDLQLHSYAEFASIGPHRYNTRAYNLIKGLSDIVLSQELDAVCVAGDFFHNRASLDIDILDLAHKFVRQWANHCRVILLAGNHDQFLLDGSITSLGQFSSYCDVVEQATVLDISGVPIAFSPFRETEQLIEQDLSKLQGKSKILVGHWTVKGASTGCISIDTGIDPLSPLLTSFKHVLLGDIHMSQKLGRNITYFGSPCQHDFGERNDDKFVWLLDGEELTSQPTSFPKFVNVDTLEAAEEFKRNGYYVNFKAKTREQSNQAAAKGLRITNEWVQTVSGEDRPLIKTVDEALEQYCKNGARPDLLELGRSYMRGLIQERAIPSHTIQLISLEAQNFFSYETLSIDFSKNHGLVIINGIVMDEVDIDSNGAGKTTVFEALLYALYGYTLRFKKHLDQTIREGFSENVVKLTFSLSSDSENVYVIERKRPSGLSFTASKSQKPLTRGTSADTQGVINGLVGSMDFFLRVAFLAVHYNPSFLSLGDTDKKVFIDKFSGLDIFDRAQKKVSIDLLKVESELNQVAISKTKTEAAIESTRESLASTQSTIDSFEEEETKKEKERLSRANSLDAEANSLQKKEEMVVDNSKETALREEIDGWQKDLSEESIQYKVKLANIQSKIEDATAIINSSFQVGSTCHGCGYTFDGSENMKERSAHAKETLSKIREEKEALSAEIEPLLKQAQDKVDDLKKQLKQEVQRLVQQREEAGKILTDNARIDQQISSKRGEASRLRVTKRSSSEALRNQLNSYSSRLQELIGKSSELSQSEAEKNDFKGRLSYWINGFGTKGCKSLLYTSLLDNLNLHIQSICNVISGGRLSVKLLPFQEGEDKNQEKISVEVVNQTGSSVLAGDSFGERGRIDLAVNLALRKTLIESSGYNCNLLFVDEPGLGIDKSGKRSIYKLLLEESKSCHNLFVTDHDSLSKGELDLTCWTAVKRLDGGVRKSELLFK
jgi:DNA repair exonuclease SbcCD ATPase subunit/DNA repair exonuclease SbcCD nuclease subunit